MYLAPTVFFTSFLHTVGAFFVWRKLLPKKLTKEEWIAKAMEVHGDSYDYSKVEYVNSYTKVLIGCKKCGTFFEQKFLAHATMGQGCPICNGTRLMSNEEFIEKAKMVHGDKFDYSKTEYVGANTLVTVICKACGREIQQAAYNHLHGRGCKYCNHAAKLDTDEVISRFRKIHGEKYDYSQMDYVKDRTKVKIICPKHGEFWQTPRQHWRGDGCPKCRESRGEKIIRAFLEREKIGFERNKTYPDLIDRSNLSYDFFIPKLNLLIEFNGAQHYEYKKDFHKDEHDFHLQRHHDWLKRKYARKNNIELLVISYKRIKKLDTILEEELNGRKEKLRLSA